MYLSHFGLSEKPFSITPDPRYLYMSEQHREAMAHLTYGVTEGGGFVQLTGEVGTGKTTICRCLLDRLPEKVVVALINNPRINERQFLAAVCDELGISYPKAHSSKLLIDKLNDYLLEAHASGARVVLIVDEAQNLSRGVLERVRLLTNLETAKKKLLQIILIGQPELEETLARPDLRQLAQRITARYSIDTLSRKDTTAYIKHRLNVAGCDEPIFTNSALRLVHRKSGGVPRLINVLCDYALLGAYAKGVRRVTRDIMSQAVREVFGEQKYAFKGPRPPQRAWIWAAAGAAAVAIGVYLFNTMPIPGTWWQSIASTTNEMTPTDAGARQAAMSPSPRHGVTPTGEDDAAATSLPTAMALPDTPAVVDLNPLPSAAPEIDKSLTRRLENNPDQATLTNGFAGLTRLWGRPGSLDDGESLCDGAARLGLGCLESAQGFDELERLNRTALLPVGVTGDERYLLLVESDATTVTVDIAGETSVHSRDELTQLWDGRFTILWRPPVTAPTIRPGAPGEEVIWLRRALDFVLNESSLDENNPIYDDNLSERVRRVQKELGLQATGEVDARTLIVLNTLLYAATDGTPTLRAL